ncbi:hypothetical protein [Xanthobacter sp. ZOL 2024]
MERFQRTTWAGSAAKAQIRDEGYPAREGRAGDTGAVNDRDWNPAPRPPAAWPSGKARGSAGPDTWVDPSSYDPPHGAPAFAMGAVEALKAEVADLRARLSHAAPRRAVVEMDRAITLLHHRVEDLWIGGLGDGQDDVALLADELMAVRAGLDEMRAPERFEALSAGLDLLARKIDILNAKAIDPVEMARLQAQSAELKSLVTRTLSGSALQPLAERLAACAEQITRAGEETAQRVAEATSALERNAEALLSRVDAYEARAREGQSASAEELRRDVEANVRTLHDRLDGVSAQLSRLSPALGADLAERLGAVLDRLDVAQGAGTAVVSPLAEVVEHHLMALTERFQSAQVHLQRLDGIEDAIGAVMEELRGVRHASVVAAQGAVEEAVEAVTRKVSTDTEGPVVVGLKRGLAALEARQTEVERRASMLMGEGPGMDLQEAPVVLDRTADDVWSPQVTDPQVADPQVADPQVADPQAPAAAAPPVAPVRGGRDAGGQDPATLNFVTLDEERLDAGAPDVGSLDRNAMDLDAIAADARDRDAGDAAWAPEPDAWAEVFAGLPADGHPQEASPTDAGPQQAAAQEMNRAELRAEPREPAGGSRPRKTLRVERSGRERKDARDAETTKAEAAARPRVDRHALGRKRQMSRATSRPARRRVSPALIAASGLVLLLTATGAAAWSSRDALMARATQTFERLKSAAVPSAVLTQGPTSTTAELPVPTGPQPLRTAALEGNLAAAYEVGVRYADGVGVPVDLDAGIKWLGYAVSNGFAPAAYRLGSLYENTLHNMDEAYRFYKWAAEQGNVRAMHNLAVLYSQGIDGAPDWGRAIEWFRKAANLGLKDSQHNLGIIFARGMAGTSDLTEALTWFEIAAAQGDQDSADKRDALVKEADAAVLAKAKRAAAAFVPKPQSEGSNQVAVLPEWNASEAGEHMAANAMLFSKNRIAAKQ